MPLKDSNIKNKVFYRGKKVLLTGDTGFKGAWLSMILHHLGAEIYGLSLDCETGSLYERISGNEILTHFGGDIRDIDIVSSVLEKIQPEIVFHLAAYGFINECYNDPIRAYSTNVMGTLNLLQCVRNCDSVKSLVLVSTDKVYNNKGDGAIYKESDLLGGVSPYSGSKTCMEMLIKDYVDTYFDMDKIGISVVRASNVLAGGDHIKSRLIPSILDAISSNRSVEIRNPNQTRPWQFVIDALDGYMTVGRLAYNNPKAFSGEWNIGPTADGIRSVQWVYDTMKKKFDGLSSMQKNDFTVKESGTLGLDIRKMLGNTDWEPRVSCENVVGRVVDFYIRDIAGESVREICKDQIIDYYGE